MNDTIAFFLFFYTFFGPSLIATVGAITVAVITVDNGTIGRVIVMAGGLVLAAFAQVIHFAAVVILWESVAGVLFNVVPLAFGLGAIYMTWVIHRAVRRSDIGRMPDGH